MPSQKEHFGPCQSLFTSSCRCGHLCPTKPPSGTQACGTSQFVGQPPPCPQPPCATVVTPGTCTAGHQWFHSHQWPGVMTRFKPHPGHVPATQVFLLVAACGAVPQWCGHGAWPVWHCWVCQPHAHPLPRGCEVWVAGQGGVATHWAGGSWGKWWGCVATRCGMAWAGAPCGSGCSHAPGHHEPVVGMAWAVCQVVRLRQANGASGQWGGGFVSCMGRAE